MSLRLKDLEILYKIEDISNYYSNHSLVDSCKYFNTTRDILLAYIKKYNIKKFNRFEDLKSRFSKSDVENIYYNEEATLTEQIQNLGISIESFHKLREYYSIPLKGQKQLECSKARKSQAYFSKSEEERDIIRQKIVSTSLNTWASKSEEDKLKLSEAHKKVYSLLTLEEMENIKVKKHNTWKSKSQEEWELINNKRLDTWRSKSQEDMLTTYEKRLNSFNLQLDETFKKLFYSREDSIEYLKDNPSTYTQLAERFNLNYAIMNNWASRLNIKSYIKKYTSHMEDALYDLLTSFGVEFETHSRKIIPPQELDFYIPSKNLAIEFNGTFWHGFSQLGDKNYHLNKSKSCEEKGIRLIHIWEYEWNDPIQKEKIIQLLKIALGLVDNKIYARNCSVKIISNKEAKELNSRIHLQGHRNAQVTYGLFYKEELVQLMSFSKSRYNRNLKGSNSWEIIRGCPGSNNIVVGGVSKLFTHFVRDYNPDTVFSYCDFNKFDGKSYEALGMKFIGYTGPDMKYVINKEVINRSPSNYKYNNSHCEDKLYGSGSKKYLWEK